MMNHKQVPMKNPDGTMNADHFVALARDALTLYGEYAGARFLYKLGASVSHVAFAQRLNDGYMDVTVGADPVALSHVE